MKEVIELLGKYGNVLDCSDGFFGLNDLDSCLKIFDKAGKYTENVVFCSEKFLDSFRLSMQMSGRAGYYQDQKSGAMNYAFDWVISRGTYEFYFCVKGGTENHAVIMPIHRLTDEDLSRNSILIKL